MTSAAGGQAPDLLGQATAKRHRGRANKVVLEAWLQWLEGLCTKQNTLGPDFGAFATCLARKLAAKNNGSYTKQQSWDTSCEWIVRFAFKAAFEFEFVLFFIASFQTSKAFRILAESDYG